MDKVIGGLIGVGVLIVGFLGFSFFGGDSIRVASFNGEVFGDAKISEIGVDYYAGLIGDYDLFFLLEIRDKDGSSFRKVCDSLVGYECYLSNRSGRSVSKEQVGVFWRNESLDVIGFGAVDDEEDLFEREPIFVELDNGMVFYVVHLKPEDVALEMGALEEVVGEEDRVVLIGDFNADCDYYDDEVGGYFSSWNWVIGDGVDTTTGASDCAYDRVITKGVRVIDSGVVGIDEDVSDHKLVFLEVGN